MGAGVHGNCIPSGWREADAKRLLSSWDALLSSVGIEGDAVSPLVRWELALADSGVHGRHAAAAVRERALQRLIAARVAEAEARLFNHGAVSMDSLRAALTGLPLRDVICLNFDLTVQRLVQPKLSSWTRVNSPERRWALSPDSRDSISVWHPHGDCERASSIGLGVRHYQRHTARAEQLWRRLKQREREGGGFGADDVATSWIDLMVTRPLLIVGSSLCTSDWDVWFALVMRWRNFAKQSHRKFEPPIWILSVPGSHRDLPLQRISRLEAPDWNSGWARLAEAMNSR